MPKLFPNEGDNGSPRSRGEPISLKTTQGKIILAVFLVGCVTAFVVQESRYKAERQFVADTERIHKGMTLHELQAILGEPINRRTIGSVDAEGNQVDQSRFFWRHRQYGFVADIRDGKVVECKKTFRW